MFLITTNNFNINNILTISNILLTNNYLILYLNYNIYN